MSLEASTEQPHNPNAQRPTPNNNNTAMFPVALARREVINDLKQRLGPIKPEDFVYVEDLEYLAREVQKMRDQARAGMIYFRVFQGRTLEQAQELENVLAHVLEEFPEARLEVFPSSYKQNHDILTKDVMDSNPYLYRFEDRIFVNH